MGVSDDDGNAAAAHAAPALPWWNLLAQAELRMVSPVAPADVKATLKSPEVAVSDFAGRVLVRLESRRRNFTETWASVQATPIADGSQLVLRYGVPIWIMGPLVLLVLIGVGRLAFDHDYFSAGTWGCVFLGVLGFGRYLARDDARRLHGHIVHALGARLDPVRGVIE